MNRHDDALGHLYCAICTFRNQARSHHRISQVTGCVYEVDDDLDPFAASWIRSDAEALITSTNKKPRLQLVIKPAHFDIMNPLWSHKFIPII